MIDEVMRCRSGRMRSEKSVDAEGRDVGAETPGADPADEVEEAAVRVASLRLAGHVAVRVEKAAGNPGGAEDSRRAREGKAVEEDAKEHLRQDLESLFDASRKRDRVRIQGEGDRRAKQSMEGVLASANGLEDEKQNHARCRALAGHS